MMMGCDGERLPRQSSAQQFCSALAEQALIGDRAGLRLPRDATARAAGPGAPERSAATARGSKSGGTAQRAAPTNARAHARREDRVRRSTKPARPGRGAQRSQPTLLWVSPATTWYLETKKRIREAFQLSTRTGRVWYKKKCDDHEISRASDGESRCEGDSTGHDGRGGVGS